MRHFADRDWNVIATMRSPREDVLPSSERVRVLALDVTEAASIADAIAAAGPIDAVVNNAGIGFLNALEGTPIDTARGIFETNTLGTIAMMQAVLPQALCDASNNTGNTIARRTAPLRSHVSLHSDSLVQTGSVYQIGPCLDKCLLTPVCSMSCQIYGLMDHALFA